MSLPGGVEHERHLARRARESAEMSSRRHAADEDAGVSGVRLHPDAIAEYRAAAEWAGRIDGDHAHRLPAFRISPVRRSTSVLLPEPGAPVTPIR